jgi:hypothetical protein
METVWKDGKEYKLVPIKQEKKTEALFILTMPKNNSWNNRWSGDDKLLCISKTAFRRNKPVYPNLKEGNYGYDFEDGWFANVNVKFVTPSEARQQMKKSAGFYGYDWMVDQICQHGRIIPRQERISNQK